METTEYLQFENYDIPMIISIPDMDKPNYPCLIMLHGFMAYKEGDGFLFRVMARRFAKQGIATIRFDFCSMGESRGSREKYGLEQMLNETEEVYRFASAYAKIDSSKIGLMGHSLGGRAAVLCTQLNPICIVTLNGALDESMEGLQKQWKKDECLKYGHAIMKTSEGNPQLLYPKFFNDLNAYHIADTMNHYRGSVLICIGKDDPTVDPQVSINFYNKMDKNRCQMLTIDNANHTFNAKTRSYEKVNELIDDMLPWLIMHLAKTV